ncbi:adenosylcobinamide-GDP ribazoletransferase [Halobacterium hubeiense]|uniref:adenosylcobinamide-GDP ribazoletransferase n=1 Tax=Halobacterium hubeiense TaxID=1407499 RepID=UPI003C739062
MVVAALRGALGFLTRLRVGHGERAWTVFRASPWAFPLAGYAVGALLAVPFLADGLPAGTVALAYLAAVFALTGINHLDGVADVGDALVVHGDSAERTRVLKDTTVGVGAVATVAVAVAGLALGALGVAGLPTRAAVAVVVAAEVGAKFGMAAVACLGTAAHEGLGSQFTERASGRDLLLAGVVAAPAAVLSWPTPAAAGALLGAVAAGLVVLWRLRALLDGVNGDVFGAVNEVGRVVGLHVGVVAWTLS